MATIAQVPERPRRPGRPFAAWHRWDRNFFAALIAFVWLGILMGFGLDIADHIARNRPAFPLIVHIHAVVFVGWLALFTVQAGLIRARRPALHRRLGLAMAGLAVVVPVIGMATALYVDRLHLHDANPDPNFIFIQASDMLAFTLLVGAGLALRARPSVHKRLMLISLLYISDAGFGRWIGDGVAAAIASPYWADFAGDYLASDLGILALGLYDLVTRRRLHPAYVAAALGAVAVQLAGTWGHVSPAARPLALALIGG